MPSWLLADVRNAIRDDGTMAPDDLLLYTRALLASPEAFLEPPPADDLGWRLLELGSRKSRKPQITTTGVKYTPRQGFLSFERGHLC